VLIQDQQQFYLHNEEIATLREGRNGTGNASEARGVDDGLLKQDALTHFSTWDLSRLTSVRMNLAMRASK